MCRKSRISTSYATHFLSQLLRQADLDISVLLVYSPARVRFFRYETTSTRTTASRSSENSRHGLCDDTAANGSAVGINEGRFQNQRAGAITDNREGVCPT